MVSTAPQIPCPIKLKAGVRHLGWMTAMRRKKTPSCAMARYTREPERVQADAESGDQLTGAQAHGQTARRLRTEVRPMSLADGEPEDNEDCHGAELCPGG